MELGDEVTINGIAYVRADVARVRYAKPVIETWCGVRELAGEHHIDMHRVYDAIRDGVLPARRPAGAKRGWKVRRCDFDKWVNEAWEAS